jgi:hypothetical protein
MEATRFSDTLIDFQRNTRCYSQGKEFVTTAVRGTNPTKSAFLCRLPVSTDRTEPRGDVQSGTRWKISGERYGGAGRGETETIAGY